MKTVRLLILTAVLSIGLASTGCVKRVPLSTTQSAQLTSNQALGVLAEANRTATSITISLNANHMLSDDLTSSILGYNKIVARAVQAAVTVQQGNNSESNKSASILALLKSIKIPPSVSAFINAPAAQPELASLIVAMNSMTSGIRALIGGN